MSGIIVAPQFRRFFHDPDSLQIGSIVAILEIGALGMRYSYESFCYADGILVTSIASGHLGDLIGRKLTLFFGAIVFTLGGVLQTFTNGIYMLMLGRIISGFGVGVLSYVAEYTLYD